jgi:hypothetical protein
VQPHHLEQLSQLVGKEDAYESLLQFLHLPQSSDYVSITSSFKFLARALLTQKALPLKQISIFLQEWFFHSKEDGEDDEEAWQERSSKFLIVFGDKKIFAISSSKSDGLERDQIPFFDLSRESLDSVAKNFFPNHRSKKFSLTTDNLKKLLLMKTFIEADIPIVLMGETGTGKTFLVNQFGRLMGWKVKTVEMHGDIHEKNIVKDIETAEKMIEGNNPVILFFDELNTSSAGSLVKEILCDKMCKGTPVNPKIKVIAAGNPHRVRDNHFSQFGFTPSASKHHETGLVYQVHPLPKTLEKYVWNFGSLSEEDERQYIETMANSRKGILEKYASNLQGLIEIVFQTHHFVRQRESSVSIPVSLRDIDRAFTLFPWLVEAIQMDQTPFTPDVLSATELAVTLGLAVCYYFRFQEDQRHLLVEFLKGSKNSFISAIGLQFIQQLKNCMRRLTNCFALESDIIATDSFQENLFLSFICIQTRIPLLLIGKPGTSKSLVLSILLSQMKGKRSAHEFLRNPKMKHLYGFYLQCSHSTTASLIRDCFRQADKIQQSGSSLLSVVIMEEIGLSELNPKQPLKVIHGLLDNFDVAFVGTSNWVLDPAKMNRAVNFRSFPHFFFFPLIYSFSSDLRSSEHSQHRNPFILSNVVAQLCLSG